MLPILIFFNAFFVASEMALARIRRTRIDQLAEEGNKTAVLVQQHLIEPDRFISACQLGITFATLALGAIGENAFADDLVRLVSQSGLPDSKAVTSAVHVACYFVAFSITAFLQTIFGELIPKTWTFQRAETVMMVTIWPMEAWCWLTSPALVMLNKVTTLILKAISVEDPPSHHFVHTEEELKMLVSASHEEGVLEEEEEEMLHSVFDFSGTHASEVMTPRTDMVCISADSTIKEFVELALKHGLSRLPVYEEGMDSIFGAIHIRDGLRAYIEKKEHLTVRDLARKVLIVPENKPVGDLLTEFKKTKTHMAIVIDEYGSARGLLTIEDLLEELVGEIADEHEIVQVMIEVQEDGTHLVDAKLSLYDANQELGLQIVDDEFNTLGGHVFGLLGREPQAGDEVSKDGYTLRIEEADKHRIIKLRVIRHTALTDHGEAAESATKSDGDKTANKTNGDKSTAEIDSKSLEHTK